MKTLPAVKVVYQPPPWVQIATPAPPSHVEKGPEDWTLPKRVNLGTARTQNGSLPHCGLQLCMRPLFFRKHTRGQICKSGKIKKIFLKSILLGNQHQK